MNTGVQLLLALPRWKLVLLALAGCLVVSGGAMHGIGFLKGDDPAADRAVSGDQPSAKVVSPDDGAKAGKTGLLPGIPRVGSSGPDRPDGPAPGEPDDGDGPGSSGDASVLGSGWPPAMVKGGLSFVVAFAIGFALRLFIRLSMIYLGLVCLTLLGLSWLGWVEIHWAVPGDQFETLASGLREQFESFRSFLQGSLPAAGMAGLGLFAGLRKK